MAGAVAQFFFSVGAVQVKSSVLSSFDLHFFDYLLDSVVGFGLFLFQEIFQHLIIIIMKKDQEDEFCTISLAELFERAYDCEVRVVGAIKEIFKHKKYIVEVLIKDEIVIRSLKRYSEFEALHQVIQMNFKNIDLNITEFPSKFQVVNRQQTRRKFFQKLLNKIIHIYLEKITNETNRRLLSTLFVFLSGNNKGETSQTAKSKRKVSSSFGSAGSESIGEKEEYVSAFRTEENEEEEPKKRERVKTLGSQQMEEYSKKKIIEETDLQSEEGRLRAFMATEFLIRFEDEPEWKQRYLKLDNTCLLIYRHKHQNHFKSKIQLFQAKIEYLHRQKNAFDHFCEKMQLDNEPLFSEDQTILTISHTYDFQKLLIRIKPGQLLDIDTIKQIFRKASREKIVNDIEGVFSPIGKMFIILHKILLVAGKSKALPIIYARIKNSGLVYETKRMTCSFQNPLNIRQGFMIPISNAFSNILIEVVSIQNEGIIRHESQQKCIGYYKISFADFMSYPSGKGLQKLKVKIQQDTSSKQAFQGFMEISIMNHSHWTSLYADSYANQNDGLIMSGLKKTSDTDELVITVDRVLRVVGHIALFITAFWRNVYLFKYPRMGYVFFTFLIILFNLGSAFTYLRLFLFSLLVAMIYHFPPSRRLILNILDVYFFNYIHKYFIPPLCLSSNELKFRKWTSNLISIKQDYRLTSNGKIEKTQQARDKKYEEWSFTIHQKTFNIRQECPGFFQKVFEVKKIVQLVLRMISAVINTLQKIFNVLCWADPRRSVIIFGILLFVSIVASTYIFQIIGTIFCVHRLYKGITFYKSKHYANNRKLAVYCLRYIINGQFSSIIGNKEKKIVESNQADIELMFHDIYFPLKDEERLKKLKNQIEHILGVYIDGEELEKREDKSKEKKGLVALIHLVSIIESCEARLKLQWISGQQGISDEFQELKKLTNQQLLIDLWVESLLINFFLNIPSQLYTTFRNIRSEQSLKFQKSSMEDEPNFKRIAV